MFKNKGKDDNNAFQPEKKKKPTKLIVGVVVILLIATIFGGGKKNNNDAQQKDSRIEKEERTETANTNGIIDVEMSVDSTQNEDTGFVTFDLKTNLPEGSNLMFTLSNSSGYRGQGKFNVEKDGRLTTDSFSNMGEPLIGKYILVVSMGLPSTQTDDVRKVIGERGENLAGVYVMKSESGDANYVSAEFDFEFAFEKEEDETANGDSNIDDNPNPSSTSELGEEDDYKKKIDSAVLLIDLAMGEGFSKDDYKVYYDEENDLIMVNTWKSNIAAGAILAASGEEESLKAWASLRESMCTMSQTFSGLAGDLGLDGYKVVVNILNDLNKENVLLTVANGIVIYDALA